MAAPTVAEAGLLRPRPRITVRALRHLKWPALDILERSLMVLCALLLLGFTLVELADVFFRTIRRPWLEANEFAIGFFVWGVFLGMGVAVRRDQHFRLTAAAQALRGRQRWLLETLNRLIILAVAACMIIFGYKNFLNGFGSFLMPSLTPIAVLYAAIPVAGALIAVFTIEELVNGWRRGFEAPEGAPSEPAGLLVTSRRPGMDTHAVAIVVMVVVFLYLGYQGVPVAFALIAGALLTTALFTKITLASIVGQMFNGINQLEFLAIPFFLLTGDMMTSANITERLIGFAQVLVGHFRSGLAHVVSLSSMLFAGISGSMTADVAAISTVVMPYMEREGYSPAFSAALVAAASTIAAMVPPSIMAIIYGAVGNVSIAGLFLGGATPGIMVAIGLMTFSYFFGPPGIRKQRATLGQMAGAARAALLPLMIPIIIVGGVAFGVITPSEAGMIAVVYILVVLLPLLNRGHIRDLPRDFMEAAILYSLPMAAVASASAVGWLQAFLGGPDIVKGWIQGVSGGNRIIIMYMIVVALTIAGDFLDGAPAIAIFIPIITALAQLGHINPVHMGVLVIVSLAFGLITPPYGLILLLASTLAGVSFTRALRQSVPLYAVFFLVITLIIMFPNVVLWLPRLVIPQSVGCFPNPSGAGYICPPN